jgi:hypothetical protein
MLLRAQPIDLHILETILNITVIMKLKLILKPTPLHGFISMVKLYAAK